MPQLKTDWICLAVEGETVDGRVIEKQALLDIAESYDPNLYTALIWPEHQRDTDPMGEVIAVKAEEENGTVRLLGVLRPFLNLLIENSNNRLLFPSIELSPDGNFKSTGKTYLIGLGATNTPASTGTSRFHFSLNSQRNKHMSKQAKKSWRNLFKFNEENPTSTDPTLEQQVAALAQALKEAEETIATLQTELAATKTTVDEVESDMETVKEVIDNEEFAELKKNLPKINQKFSLLDKVATHLPSNNPAGEKKPFQFL